ncbi:MAG TPA: sensor histidine kinase, partial [Naasia sp.]
GAFASEDLRERVTGLQASRAAAVSAEDTALRRLERDIHDGPQQRLVRLQMDLATAERKLADDPAAARDLLAEARSQSAEALEELRALSRGFSPPLLLDRGLAVALESLCARNPIPTTLDVRLGNEPLPPALERNLYFLVAEALTNAAKHSSAETAAVRIARHEDEVLVEVRDDGLGGASRIPGHGIVGLEERVRGLDGTFDISSPAGGPTVITVTVPLAGSGAASR